jgi:hypothetical protein
MANENTGETIPSEPASIMEDWERALTIPGSETDTEEQKPGGEEEGESKKTEAQEQKPEQSAELDLSILETELERHGQKKLLKEFLKEPENQQWLKEEFQKKWDYDERKNEVKTEKEKLKVLLEGKTEELSKREQTANEIMLQNLAYKINQPLKTLEDFENDIRYDDPESAYQEWKESFENEAQSFIKKTEYAKAVNENNITSFAEKHPDLNVQELLAKAIPYINASTSMEHEPFPDNTLEILDKAFNFDKYIENAKAEERKKVLSELSDKQKGRINQPTGKSPGNTSYVPTGNSLLDDWERAMTPRN